MVIKPASMLTSIIKFCISLAIIYGGVKLHPYLEAPYELASPIIIVVGSLAAMKHALVFTLQSFHVGGQVDLLTRSRLPSGDHGASFLAGENDPNMQPFKNTKGLYLGVLGKSALFYDPFFSGHGHLLTYAPSRTGKTISSVIPALLHWFGGSMFVIDVKGELWEITSARRKIKGQTVIKFDPFNVASGESFCFNPLEILTTDIKENSGNNLGYLVKTIVLQLLPDPSNEAGDGQFFRSGARRLITAMMLYMAVYQPSLCNLPSLRRLIWASDEEKLAVAQELQSKDWFGGLLQDYGNSLTDMLRPEYIKTYGAFRDNAMDALEIYDAHSEFGKSLERSDFTLVSLLDENTTIYLILPESKLETHGRLLGLITSLLMENIAQQKAPSKLLMMLEEMGNLGRLANLNKALSLLPGKGLRLWMIFQSPRQPLNIYGKNMSRIIEEQSGMMQQWAIRSLEDQKSWSTRIGQKTIKSYSISHDPNDVNTPFKKHISERPAPVLAPEKIAQMPDEYQLIAINGKPVILARRIAYFQILPWRTQAAPSPFHPGGYPKDKPVLLKLKGAL